MNDEALIIQEKCSLHKGRCVMGLSGWMDGGDVSTGTIRYLADKLGAKKNAEIKPGGFYLYNFPGSMEIASLFRPHCKIEDGLIKTCEPPANVFYCAAEHNLLLFSGVEPNVNWDQFAETFFQMCRWSGVERIYFIGSVAGLVPHTREPRLFCSVSHPAIKENLLHYGIKLSSYEGPASIITFLTTLAPRHNIEMVSLVCAIPAYVQGYNPMCIASAVRRLAGILEIEIPLDDIQSSSEEFEKRLNSLVEQQTELSASIHKLEEDYDNEIFNSEMGDLKNWLKQQGIRLD
jgi:proteasome assembly chaperone (PAC2) family protein